MKEYTYDDVPRISFGQPHATLFDKHGRKAIIGLTITSLAISGAKAVIEHLFEMFPEAVSLAVDLGQDHASTGLPRHGKAWMFERGAEWVDLKW